MPTTRSHFKKGRTEMFKDAQTFLGTLLSNEVPDMRKEVLKHLDDKDFMRSCLLSKSTVSANQGDLVDRTNKAQREANEASKEVKKLFPARDRSLVDMAKYSDAFVKFLVKQLYQKDLSSSYAFVQKWEWRMTAYMTAFEMAAKADGIIEDKNAEIDQLKMKVVALKKLYVAK